MVDHRPGPNHDAIVTLCVARSASGEASGILAMPYVVPSRKCRAGGIAMVNAIGCNAGAGDAVRIGLIKQKTGGFGGLYFVAGDIDGGSDPGDVYSWEG